MANLGSTATEVLQYGKKVFVHADMGAFTATSMVFDGGLVHEDNATGRRVGTYATPLRTNDIVKVDTTVDEAFIVVKRMAASDTGSLLFGIVASIKGDAGATLYEATIYVPGPNDIVEFFAGTDAGTTPIAVGDKVSLDADVYSTAVPHGFRVKKDASTGFGYALNKVDALGETVRVWVKPSL